MVDASSSGRTIRTPIEVADHCTIDQIGTVRSGGRQHDLVCSSSISPTISSKISSSVTIP